MVAQPHYLLFCDAHYSDSQPGSAGGYAVSGGRWHFVLEQLDGSERLEAADSERSMNRERLALLSVVRGLEALEQPSQVSLVTTSRYVSRGLRYGLSSWRESDYTWERFGEQRPVRNSDLWRRVDTALQFHGIKCRLIQAGPSNPELTRTQPACSPTAELPAKQLPARDVAAGEFAATVSSPVCDRLLLAKRSARRPAERPAPNPAESPDADSHLRLGLATADGRQTSRQTSSGTNLQSAAAPQLRRVAYSSHSRRQWQPAENRQKLCYQRGIWWNLAATWIRWWRGRLQNRHAIYGT